MRLASLRRRARLAIWTENLAAGLAPGGFVLGGYMALVLFGFGSAPGWLVTLLLAASLLGHGLWRLRPPPATQIDRRIEQASGLRHRPISVLRDVPEDETDLAAAIWEIHRRRAAAALLSARAGPPRIGAAASDPFGLRAGLLVLLLAGIVIAGPALPARLDSGFVLPAWPFAGPVIEAWITPPAYTGAPPLLLRPGDRPAIPAGSRASLVVNGVGDPPFAAFGGRPLRLAGSAQAGFRAEFSMRASGRLRIGPWWNRLAAWRVTVSPPLPPLFAMRRPVVAGGSLLIGWQVRDRYGLAALGATLAPVGDPPAVPERFDLPVDGQSPQRADGVAAADISGSAYAGMRVGVVLTARNLAGLSARAGPMTVVLPLPDLTDRTALALASLRQRLAIAPDRGPAVAAALGDLAAAPASRISAAADLQMAVLAAQLRAGEISGGAARTRLDQLARQVDRGPDAAPAEALAAADLALEQALRQAILSGRPADAARLQALLAAMHAALAQHLRALGGGAALTVGGDSLDPGDLDRLAAQAARQAAAGDAAGAAASLARLQQLLNALQSARPPTAGQLARMRAAGQAGRELGQEMQGEAALLDQTNTGDLQPDAQAQLRRRLTGTADNLRAAGLRPPDLQPAGAAMDLAEAALRGEETGAALAAETGAIQAMQKAAADLAGAAGTRLDAGAAPAAGAEMPGEGEGGGEDEDATRAILNSGETAAGAIQRQIIRNDDDAALPAIVHRYYRRLLDPDFQ